VLAAIAAVGVALLASSNNGVQPVDRGDVPQQIKDLRQFLRDHTR
jgi:hypothetical protein